LSDLETRQKLLAVAPNLRKTQLRGKHAEELAKAIGLAIPGHNAAEPGMPSTHFQFQIPSTLPSNGGPGELIDEVHSFGMIFTGCFWDLIANLFGASASKNEAALQGCSDAGWKASHCCVKDALVTPRFVQSVGRAMTLSDQALHGGANREHIGDAFARHGIMLGSNAMMAPSMALTGAAPRGATLGAAARRIYASGWGNVRGARLSVSKTDFFGVGAVSAVQTRGVQLGSLHRSSGASSQ